MYKLSIILIAALFIISCKKRGPEKSLQQMEITGFVFDSTHQTGLANVQVRAQWLKSSPMLLYTPIKTGVTDAKGNFSLKLSIDTSRFKQENIIVSIFSPENYISYGHPQVQEALPIKYYDVTVPVQRFVLFEKALVTITFRRMQNDVIESFQSNYSFYEGDTHSLLQFTNAIATPIAISYIDSWTAANTYTKVSWTKRLVSGTTITYKDSVLCRPNTANSILIDF